MLSGNFNSASTTAEDAVADVAVDVEDAMAVAGAVGAVTIINLNMVRPRPTLSPLTPRQRPRQALPAQQRLSLRW